MEALPSNGPERKEGGVQEEEISLVAAGRSRHVKDLIHNLGHCEKMRHSFIQIMRKEDLGFII